MFYLQTHNVAMVSPIADFVVDVGSDGRILSQGSLENALAHDSKLLKEVEQETEELQKAEQEIDGEKAEDANASSSAGKLVVAEEVAVGHVGWRTSERTIHLLMHSHSDGGGSQCCCTLATCRRGRFCSGSSTAPVILCATPLRTFRSVREHLCHDLPITLIVYSELVARCLGGAVRNYSSRGGECHIVSDHLCVVGSRAKTGMPQLPVRVLLRRGSGHELLCVLRLVLRRWKHEGG